MKKALLFTLAALACIVVIAQQRISLPGQLTEQSAQQPVYPSPSGESGFEKPANYSVQATDVVEDYLIGGTIYDLQSNASVSNRLFLFEDGTVGAVWTYGEQSSPSFPDRGTGYNYFDGTTWAAEPTARIETIRTGWPSYAPWKENGEVVVSHDFAVGRTVICTRDQKGTGTWTESYHDGPTGFPVSWPRMVTSGSQHSIVHLLTATWPTGNGGTVYQGQDGAVLYSRSQDGGLTWDVMNATLPGTGIDAYNSISADEYCWAEPRGGIIAFSCVDCWHDWFIMKSTDHGETWQKLIVWEHPYPFFDWNTTITTDTMWAPDNSGDVAIDNNGMVHTVCGLTRVAHDAVGTTYSYWPWTDGIAYWNETMPPFEDPNGNPHDALDAEDVLIEDVNLIGWTQDVNNNGTLEFESELMVYRTLGISTMPNISIREEDNQIFVVWASTTETYTNGTYNFKHIWFRKSPDGGTTWGDFVDLTSDIVHIFDECIYPVAAGNVDENNFHVIYQADATPGTALDANHSYQDNNIFYAKQSIWGVGIGEEKHTGASVSQNFPNPFSGVTYIKVDLEQASGIVMEISSLVGQKISSVDYGERRAGSHLLALDVRLEPGVYFYSVRAGNTRVTHKMIVE